MFKLTTLGNLKIEYRDTTLSEECIKSDMLCKLLVYMILHRENLVKVEKIAADIWNDGQVENPSGALKNLQYRLRTLLKKYYPNDNFIISSRGYYGWNPEIECTVDVEMMEDSIKKAKMVRDHEERAVLLKESVDICRGEFLYNHDEVQWINALKMYYHSIYLNAVKELCGLYDEDRRYEEMSVICNAALEVEKLDEQIYYYQILSMVKTNNLQTGLRAYKEARQILKRGLGTDDFPKLTEAYYQLLKMNNGCNRANLASIKGKLIEEKAMGPFFCGFAVFKEIYQLETRKKERKGDCGTLLLFSVDFPYDPNFGKMEQYAADKTMEAFQDVLSSALRRGDVVSKYADYQYISLVSDCRIDNAGGVLDRINANFELKYPQYNDIKIRCEVTAADLEPKKL